MSFPLRVLVVEDQPLSRQRLVSLLAEEPGVEVVAACETGEEAIEAARQLSPDLMLVDLEIPGLNGFGVVEALAPAPPLTIFVTAHDQYAVRAFDVKAFDYLLKPFSRDRLREALARAREHLAVGRDERLARRLVSLVHGLDDEPPPTDRLMVKSAGRVVFVSLAELDAVESEGNYVRLHAGNRAWLVRETMTSIEGRLRGGRFCRIHRGWIVNLDRITELFVRPTGEHMLLAADGREYRVGRAYRNAVQQRLMDVAARKTG